MSDHLIRRIFKPLVFFASLSPIALLFWDTFTRERDTVFFNGIIRSTGYWSLRFLCLALAITPVRWLTGWHSLVKFRRMLGLLGFFYGVVHTAAYVFFRSHRGVGCGGARSLSGSNGENGIGNRRRSAPSVFRHRLHRLVVDCSACGDVHGRYDSASGGRRMAGTAPAQLSRRRRQRPSYLLASETERASLCCNSLHRICLTTRQNLCSSAGVVIRTIQAHTPYT